MPPARDVGPLDALRRDGGDAATDGPLGDAPTDGSIPTDAGRGTASQCQVCSVSSDCLPAHDCAVLSSGDTVCLRSCDIDLADCGSNLTCVANFTSSLPDPVCAPVGVPCCVDADLDLHGTGVGCLGSDCNEADPLVNSSGIEDCDGLDDDCDTIVDEGDPAALCLTGTNVATTACRTGSCAIATCVPNFADCNTDPLDGCEASLLSTTDCLSCGAACALPNVGTHACTPTGCTIIACAAGWGNCDGLPTNGCEQSLTTPAHCGGCGIMCGVANATSTCATGTCAVQTCNPRWGDCDAIAVNGCETPLVTETDCGTCGTVCAPAGGSGSCSTGSCRVTTCASGFEDCNMMTSDGCETSIRTLSNCGACGVPCSFANGTASCAVGACTLAGCMPGFGNCDGLTSNGCELTLTTLLSCGGCGVPCAPTNATGNCSSGTCGIQTCNAGFADCDGLVSNGCETSLRTVTDCGTCGTACSRTGAMATCATGTCSIGSCTGGVGNCDGNDANGCETSLNTNASCGGCGITCSRPNATSSCGSGTCVIQSCDAGFANCDGIDANGCETSLSSSSNCGGCGVLCGRANASATCATGSCRIDFCNAGYANCDASDPNGCEIGLTTLTNCGGCGTACNLPNAGESCSSGVCQITSCTSGFDDCNSTDSDGCERSLRTLSDCGSCGLPCSRAGATATCATGTCSILSCNPGVGNCDGSDTNGCETPLTTATNCAGCGLACNLANAAASCASGTCTLGACTAGFGNCDGVSANGCEASLTTLLSCGTCGTACSPANASASCATGTCAVTSCNSGFENCNGTVPDGCERSTRTLTDCGGCGVPCSRAGATATCATGTCGILSCNAGVGNCDGIDSNGCERSLTTLTNCSSCGTVCDLPNAAESCTTGACVLGACTAGFGNCNGVASDGCETALNTLTNCVTCGTICDLPGAGESCATGTCQLSGCAAGMGDCDMMSGNGCETPLNTVTNCAGCGTACALANATESCSTGTCTLSSCNAGFGNCDALTSTGCEAALTSVTNCGSCGVACTRANAAESCSTGSCVLGACDPGFGNCDANATNGCEVALTSLTNCGACGTACTIANGTGTCSTGSCAVNTCNAGFANCDGNPANGCEVNTNTSTGNCGGCGSVCSPPNATPACTAGSCGIGSCNAGFGDCTGAPGCETPTTTTSNCGSCGSVCSFPNAGASCPGGTCTLTMCNSGFADCTAAAGCETSTTTTSNCGGCGLVCSFGNASASCPGGTCTFGACNAGFADCSAPLGCETATNTVANCGGCGLVCSRANATPTCSTGSCAISSCNGGFGNCDANDPNGCEVNLTNTPTRCGSCSTNCTSPLPANTTTAGCSASACTVASCAAGYYNPDNVFTNGCECLEDAYGNNCGAATPIPGGVLIDNAAARVVSGNLVGPGFDEDWFTITVSSSACTYLPLIVLGTSAPVAMQIYTTCAGSVAGGTQTCGGGAEPANSGLNITTWEYRQSATCGDLQPIDPTPNSGPFFQLTTIYIRVIRTGSSSTCMPYTLTVSA